MDLLGETSMTYDKLVYAPLVDTQSLHQPPEARPASSELDCSEEMSRLSIKDDNDESTLAFDSIDCSLLLDEAGSFIGKGPGVPDMTFANGPTALDAVIEVDDEDVRDPSAVLPQSLKSSTKHSLSQSQRTLRDDTTQVTREADDSVDVTALLERLELDATGTLNLRNVNAPHGLLDAQPTATIELKEVKPASFDSPQALFSAMRSQPARSLRQVATQQGTHRPVAGPSGSHTRGPLEQSTNLLDVSMPAIMVDSTLPRSFATNRTPPRLSRPELTSATPRSVRKESTKERLERAREERTKREQARSPDKGRPGSARPSLASIINSGKSRLPTVPTSTTTTRATPSLAEVLAKRPGLSTTRPAFAPHVPAPRLPRPRPSSMPMPAPSPSQAGPTRSPLKRTSARTSLLPTSRHTDENKQRGTASQSQKTPSRRLSVLLPRQA